jgi:hypothetical protein
MWPEPATRGVARRCFYRWCGFRGAGRLGRRGGDAAGSYVRAEREPTPKAGRPGKGGSRSRRRLLRGSVELAREPRVLLRKKPADKTGPPVGVRCRDARARRLGNWPVGPTRQCDRARQEKGVLGRIGGLRPRQGFNLFPFYFLFCFLFFFQFKLQFEFEFEFHSKLASKLNIPLEYDMG